jgi:predicted component of type VI protein secretion system
MPRLVIRKGEGVGKDHALGGECVVGRQTGCTFVLEDTLASRRHFRVLQEGGAWWVEDLGSTNGTIVNGRKLSGRHRLSDGDVLSAGNTELLFVQKDLLGAAGAPAPARAAVPPVVPDSGSSPGATTMTPPPASKPAPGPAAAPPPTKRFDAPIPRKRRER